VRAAGATAAAGAVLAGVLVLLPGHSQPPAAAGPQPGSSGAPGQVAQPSGASGTSAGRPGVASRPSGDAVSSAHPAPTVPGNGLPPGPAVLASGGPASGAPAAGGPAAGGSSSQPTSSAAVPAAAGTLRVSPTTVQVGLSITLTAEGGPVSYSITAPVALAVSPAAGSLTAGESVTVLVSLALGNLLATDVTLTVYPGPTSVIVVPLSLTVGQLAP